MLHIKYCKRLLIVIVLVCICVGVLQVVYKPLQDIKLFTRYSGHFSHHDEKVLNSPLRQVISKTAAVTIPVISETAAVTIPVISKTAAVTMPVISKTIAVKIPVISETAAVTKPFISKTATETTPVTTKTDAVTKPVTSATLIFKSSVRVFNTSADYSSAKQIHKCVVLKIPPIANTPICVYDPAIDIYVSKSIINQGNWEGDLIRLVVNIIQGLPDTVFLDFGCNVGVYTLAIAKFGRQVTALDANRKNLEMLTTSLQKGHLTKMVTLIWNALSDKAETVGFKEDTKNIGGLQMVGEVKNTTGVSDENSSVAILLDDLVPMFRNKSVFIKMDIETYELKAMLGGKKFFEEVDVKFLLMEWMHHKSSNVGTGIIQFMTKRGYTPYSPLQRSAPLKIEDRQLWSNDIIWIKNSMNVTRSA